MMFVINIHDIPLYLCAMRDCCGLQMLFRISFRQFQCNFMAFDFYIVFTEFQMNYLHYDYNCFQLKQLLLIYSFAIATFSQNRKYMYCMYGFAIPFYFLIDLLKLFWSKLLLLFQFYWSFCSKIQMKYQYSQPIRWFLPPLSYSYFETQISAFII